MDIPTHTSDFFPTHFLYPLSNVHVNGMSWGSPWFMLLNYSGLLIIYGFLIFLWEECYTTAYLSRGVFNNSSWTKLVTWLMLKGLLIT
jgi:uncharacterized SAM-binding protein YcdF (DUF218 family)